MKNILRAPFDRGHEFLAYRQQGFSNKEIGEIFDCTEAVATKVIENYANRIQKEKWKAHLKKIEKSYAGSDLNGDGAS